MLSPASHYKLGTRSVLAMRTGWVLDGDVAETIRKVFEKLNELEFTSNRTTGLHVHIGIEGATYNIAQIREIAKLVLLFEGRMKRLHN
jgi:hypothetical protein